METNLAQTMDIAEEKARYDELVKEILADKQVLARILKYTLEEFTGFEISDIIDSIDTPQISRVRMEPGHTNTEKIQAAGNEDSIPGEEDS